MLFIGELNAQTNLSMLNSTKVTTSHVSPWESLNAVNDGFVPISSEDRTNPVYGNWDGEGAYNTYNWIEYEWDFAHAINSVGVYWFTDYGGIGQPTDAYIQYWDGINWVNGGTIGLALNQFNTVGNLNFKSRKLRIYMSKEKTILSFRFSGTSPSTILCAKPSAMAVLPTPGSPTSIGLFFVLRVKICNTRRISSSRPITGSSFPVRANSFKFLAYLFNEL